MCNNDFISNFIEPFSKWQLRSAFLIFLLKIPSSWFMACLIFTAKTPLRGEYFCRGNLNCTPNDVKLWIEAAHLYKYDSIEQEDSYDFCYIFDNAESRYRNETTDTGNELQRCYDFEQIVFYNSLIHQYELYCSKDVLVPVTQSFHLLGVLIGGLVANQMLKKKSPKEIMLLGLITQILFGLATGYAPTYAIHVTFRSLVAAACSLMCTSIITLVDISSGKIRVIILCIFEQFWSIGVMLLPFIGAFWQSWRHVYLAISLPSLFFFLIYPLIPDSPQWLIKHARLKDASKVLFIAARVNRKDFDKNLVVNELNNLSKQYRNEPEEPSIWSIWKGNFSHKKNLLIYHVGWSIYISLFFASLLHVRALGRKNLEINTVIAGICELLGSLIGLYLILKKSNKWKWASLLNIFSSTLGISANFIPLSFTPFKRMLMYLTTWIILKVTISTILVLFITCTADFVTKEKQKACNYSAMTCSRTIVLAAPFIGYCSSFGSALISQNIIIALNLSMSLIIALFMKFPKSECIKSESYQKYEELKLFKVVEK